MNWRETLFAKPAPPDWVPQVGDRVALPYEPREGGRGIGRVFSTGHVVAISGKFVLVKNRLGEAGRSRRLGTEYRGEYEPHELRPLKKKEPSTALNGQE